MGEQAHCGLLPEASGVARQHSPGAGERPGPVGREPLAQSARKLGKRLAGLRPILALLFAATALVERVAPGSPVLERIYRVLLGAHIYRGYRHGASRSMRHKPAVASGLSPKCG